jgi:hypothetical protein
MSEKKTAGVFDVRTVIGALLAIYGVVLLLMAAFGDEASKKTGGVNANLWAGIVLLVVGLVFLAWVKMRPVVVEDEPKRDDDRR